MHKVFAIYDSKAEAFLAPFVMKTKGEAIRGLSQCVSDEKHNFCVFSDDFTLFELGDWDEQTGKFNLKPTPHSLCLMTELKTTRAPAREVT